MKDNIDEEELLDDSLDLLNIITHHFAIRNSICCPNQDCHYMDEAHVT
jgi:hypothetical protein